MFGANPFGMTYFCQTLGEDFEETKPPRVGGTSSISGGDLVRARIKPDDDVDLFALGQALGVIAP